jgi:hypothetical protein
MAPRILLVDGIGRAASYTELRAALDAEWLPELTPAIERDAAAAIDLAIVSQENNPKTSAPLCRLTEQGVPTLCLVDGISEWRFSWTATHAAGEPNPQYRPVLSHKIACIGRSQVRLFESWGNLGKCELVGLPRLDPLRGRRPRSRGPGAPARILITTAKTPGFTPDQVRRTEESLRDLKAWIDGARSSGSLDVEPVWRLTFDLEAKLGVKNELSDTTGRELADVLGRVDAMVTTPSTCMLEGMLQAIPVALLDYHHCPHYVPAAWSITAREHFERVMPDLLAPPPARMLYQDTILHDALECRTPAMPRLARLVQEMIRIGGECRAAGTPLAFPRRILPDAQGGHHLPEERFDLQALYPDGALFHRIDRAALQSEIGHLRARHRQDAAEIERLASRLAALDPSVRLRSVARAVVPGRLRRLLARLRRRPTGGEILSWTPPARVATPSPSALADRRDGPDA